VAKNDFSRMKDSTAKPPGAVLSHYAAILSPPFAQGGAKLGIALEDGALCAIDFLEPGMAVADRDPDSAVAGLVVDQLLAYFDDPAWEFSLPVRLKGTAFYRRTWQALTEIPSGVVSTYGALARRLGSSARAVGGACRANPVPIVIPCHRVVASTGTGGYCGEVDGAPLAVKRWLLEHERGNA